MHGTAWYRMVPRAACTMGHGAGALHALQQDMHRAGICQPHTGPALHGARQSARGSSGAWHAVLCCAQSTKKQIKDAVSRMYDIQCKRINTLIR